MEPKRTEISHYGVKGMKWGVRRSQAQLDRAAKRRSNSPAAKRKEAKSMSDAELRSSINRLQMEKQYVDLTADKKTQFGAKKVGGVLAKVGGQVVGNAAKQVATQQVKKQIEDLIKR